MAETGKRESYYRQTPYEPVGQTTIIKYYLNIIRRRFWIILAVFVVTVTIGLVRAFKTEPVYSTSAKVLVEREMPTITGFSPVSPGSSLWNPEFYKTQAELMRSRNVLEKALEQPELKGVFDAEELNLEHLPKEDGDLKENSLSVLGASPVDIPAVWKMLRSSVTTKHIFDTQFIRVTAESTNPEHAAKIANAVAMGYQQAHLAKQKSVYNAANQLLKDEKVKEEKALAEAQKAMQEFYKTANLISLGPKEADQPILDNLNRLSKQRTEVQLRRIELSSQIAVVREALEGKSSSIDETNENLFAVPAIRRDESIPQTRDSLIKARGVYENLSQVYGPEHPRLQAAKSEVELLEKQYRGVLKQVVISMANQLKTLRNEEEQLQKEHDEQQGKALDLTRELFEYTRLKNEVERHRAVFETLTERIREIDVGVEFTQMNVEVVETAGIPAVPIRPLKMKAFIVSSILGLIMGFALAFIIENLDDIIKTPEDLKQHLPVPFLGFVPEIEDKDSSMTVFYRGAISVIEPVSSIAESYRNIRTSIFFSTAAGSAQVLAMTSCGPAEGKTTTSTNLALVIAKSGKKVLLMDGDFHRPMVSKVLGLDVSFGLTNILIGEMQLADAIQHIQFNDEVIENIDILAAGPESPNPAELLGSSRMHELLDEAREKYDWIIIDTPPILFVSDASILSALSDSIIIVVKSGKNNHSVLRRTKDQIDGLNIHIMGSILNGMRLTTVGRYYSDYGYHGYSKYARNYHKSYYNSGSSEDKRIGK